MSRFIFSASLDRTCIALLGSRIQELEECYFGCLARTRYRFGDAAQDGLWYEAQGRRQDAGDGDLQVAPHPAPVALAPVSVQRPAHAEVEAGGGVADVQPPQFPLRLKRATAKKNDAFRSPSVDKQILAPEERIVFLHHLELGRKLQHVCN